MTVLEALQCGVPTAAMAIDGIREEFRDEIVMLDPAASDLEIGRRVHALLQDRKACMVDKIQRGIELVSRRFSARTLIGGIEHDYLELLTRKGSCSRGDGRLRGEKQALGESIARGHGGHRRRELRFWVSQARISIP